jgi:hypothetical protein
LHPDEEKKLKELQKDKTAEEQYRLAAAECALVQCAAGVPDGDPNKAVLQKMQTDGQGYTTEQNILKQAGAFDGYGRLEALNDGLDRYQVSNRVVGAVQGVTGAVAAGVVLGGSCTTVVACVAGAAVAGTSLDYSKAGFTQLLNGDVALTYGEQALQSLGLSPQAAAIAYAGLSIGAVAGSVAPRGIGKGAVAEAEAEAAGKGVTSGGTANAATYGNLKEQLAGENLASIAAQDPRLAAAVNGSGTKNINFNIGQGTAAEAEQLGKAWVGDGAKMTSDGTGWVSADGTRVYRAPTAKPNVPVEFSSTGIQANFQQLENGKVVSNGHLNITK